MANAWYPISKKAMALNTKAFDLDSDTIKAVLVASAYSYSAAHYKLSDLGANALGTAVTLAGISVSDAGVIDTTDAASTFSAITGTVGWIAYYDDTLGDDDLLSIADVTNFTASAEDVVVTWDNGANKLMVL